MMKRCYILMLFILSTGFSFAHEVGHRTLYEQPLPNLSFKSILKESIHSGCEGIQCAGFSFIASYIAMSIFFGNTRHLTIHKGLTEAKLYIAELTGVVSFLLYYKALLSGNGNYINLTQEEFDKAIEKCAQELTLHDTNMHSDEIHRKSVEHVTQRVRSAPARLLGGCCSLAACAVAAYFSYKNA